MNLITPTVLAIASAVAVPAAAQDYGSAPPQQAQTVPDTSANQHTKTAAATPKDAQPGVRPSNKALKAIVDLQATVKKNDFANVPAKVAAAQAVASTKEDRYLIGQLQLSAALAAKDNAATVAAIDTVAASAYLDGTKVAELYSSIGSTLYNAKQYPQALSAFQKAAAADPRDSHVVTLAGETLLAQGQKAEAAAAFQRAIQIAASSGQKPDENLLKRALSVAYDSQSPAAAEIGRQWVAAYPSASSWRNSIAVYRNLTHPDVEGTLDLLRLMQATGAMTDAGDYSLFARAAAEQNNFNEAQVVLDAGIAAKVIDPAKPEFADLVGGLKAKSKATAADLAVASAAAQTGVALVHIGDRYAAMGNYAKAIDSYRLALAKPGTDTAVANLHLGMALARSGDKTAATAALNAVTGPRAEIAKYWLIYVNQKS